MTTEFEIDHVLHATPETFWKRCHESEEFGRYLYVESLGFEYEPLEVDIDKGISKARITPRVDAPEAVVKALGRSFSMVEDGVFDRKEGVYRFSIIPSTLKERISVSGAMHVLPHGEGQCVRHMHFAVEVKIPGVGGIIEGFVERSTRANYDRSAEITNRFLEERVHGA